MIEIDFKGVEHSDAVAQSIQTKATELTKIYPDIMGCHVVLDAPHKSHKKGNIFQVHIHLKIPGENIDVTRESGQNHDHEDIYIAIRDAFNAARRLLTDNISKHRDQMTGRESIRKMDV